AARCDPDIIGTVEQFLAILFDHDGHISPWPDPPEFVFLIGAGPKISFVIERKPIGSPAGLYEGRKAAIHAPLHYAVVWLVGEKDVATSVAGRPFGEGKASG